MTRSAAILAGAALIVAGCHSPQRPSIWRKVVHAPRPPMEAADTQRAYAAELHKLLLESRVPHKIVTAEYHFQSQFQHFAPARRTMVVYRDVTRKGEGWWLMDEGLGAPVWLPNTPLERQIAFYLRRPVTIVDVSDFMGADQAKMVLPLEKTPPRKSGLTSIQPVEPKPAKAHQPKVVAPKPVAPPAPAAKSRIEPAPKPKPAPVPKVVEKPAAKAEPSKPIEKKPVPAKPVDVKPSKAPEPKKTESKEPEKPVAQPAPEKPRVPPAVKAAPSDKPTVKPALIDKTDSTPQATIVPDEPAPKKEDEKSAEEEDKAKAAEPPKTSFLKRIFRRVFRA